MELQYYHYSSCRFWQYFFGSILKCGFFLTLLLKFNTLLYALWCNLCRPSEIFVLFRQSITLFTNNLIYFFKNFNFIFFYYYQKTNKKIYKYSKARVGRYNLKFFYIPKYRRFRLLITFVLKSINYEKGRTFWMRLSQFIIKFFVDRSSLFFFKFINFIQKFIFKNYRKTLFNFSRYKI